MLTTINMPSSHYCKWDEKEAARMFVHIGKMSFVWLPGLLCPFVCVTALQWPEASNNNSKFSFARQSPGGYEMTFSWMSITRSRRFHRPNRPAFKCKKINCYNVNIECEIDLWLLFWCFIERITATSTLKSRNEFQYFETSLFALPCKSS